MGYFGITEMGLSFIVVALFLGFSASKATDPWQPTGLIHCRTNDDCNDAHVCCSITPALGRREAIQERQIPPNWDGMVHYCLPWKNENATWCELKLQYSPDTTSYRGLCPCGPGLQCTETDQLDPKYYPRDRFGKCSPVA